MPTADRRDRSIARIFDYLDLEGAKGHAAEVSITLATSDFLTVRAGGSGINARPACGPFETYEVLVDHDPPRFWRRYTDSVGALFAHVPRLLIAHHITRSGGIEHMEAGLIERPATTLMNVKIQLPPEREHDVLMAIKAMAGVDFVSARVLPQQDLQVRV